MPELFKLEQEKRTLKQNVILLERAELLFNNTPIMKGDDFLAVSIKVGATEFKEENKRMLILALAAIFGGMIASIYVIISNAMRRRKDDSVKA